MKATAVLTEAGRIRGHQTDLHPGAEEVAVEAVEEDHSVAEAAEEALMREALRSVEAEAVAVAEGPEVVEEEVEGEAAEEAAEEVAVEEEDLEAGGGRASFKAVAVIELAYALLK